MTVTTTNNNDNQVLLTRSPALPNEVCRRIHDGGVDPERVDVGTVGKVPEGETTAGGRRGGNGPGQDASRVPRRSRGPVRIDDQKTSAC